MDEIKRDMKKILLLMSMVASYGYAQYATFTPQVYKPVQRDNSILQRSFEQIERRQTEANEQFSKLQMMLAEYAAKLYNDEATLVWFDEYKRSIHDAYNTLTTIGWDEARNYAIRMQGNIAIDPELTARIKTASEYVSKRKAIEDRSDMNWQEKSEWMENNPYCFVPIKNHEGEVIGGRLGSKAEYDAQVQEAERVRQEIEAREKELEELEQIRLYGMVHAFDNYDYSKYETIVSYPPVKSSPDGVIVTKVALSSTETRVEFECTNMYENNYCCIDWQTYLTASGIGKQRQVKVENIAISPSKSQFRNVGEKLKFALTFPALPPKVKAITISETVKNGWKFKNIKIK